MQTDGVQSIAWIEANSGNIGEASLRGLGFRDTESLEGHFGPRKWIKKEYRADVREGVEDSGRTFFDKKHLPLRFLQATHRNSKVSIGLEEHFEEYEGAQRVSKAEA